MSAWLSVKDRAELSAGETVLILGATGVAGQIAIQVSRHLGAKRVIGAGRNLEAMRMRVWTVSFRWLGQKSHSRGPFRGSH